MNNTASLPTASASDLETLVVKLRASNAELIAELQLAASWLERFDAQSPSAQSQAAKWRKLIAKATGNTL